MQRFLKAGFFLFFIYLLSCSKDKLPVEVDNCVDVVTYVDDIKPIIDFSCAYSGCHVTGFVKGNYSNYSAMKNHLDNGLFKKQVLDQRQMPPQDALVGRPKFLTQSEIDLINCWAKDGYPEK